MQDDSRFRLPQTSIKLSSELYVKASETAAQLNPPMSVENFIERVVEAAIANRPVKNVVFSWPPKRENR